MVSYPQKRHNRGSDKGAAIRAGAGTVNHRQSAGVQQGAAGHAAHVGMNVEAAFYLVSTAKEGSNRLPAQDLNADGGPTRQKPRDNA